MAKPSKTDSKKRPVQATGGAGLELRCDVSFDKDSLEAAGGEKTTPSFHIVAYNGGKMRPRGFEADVVVDLNGLETGERIPVFLDHEVNGRGLVGHGTPRIAGSQLILDGIVSAATASARLVVDSAKSGFPWQASMGASVVTRRFVKAGDTALINGVVHGGPFYHVVKAKLRETSFVPIGADTTTSAAIAACLGRKDSEMAEDNDRKDENLDAGDGGAKHDNLDPLFRDWLQAQNVDLQMLEPEDVKALQATYDEHLRLEAENEHRKSKAELLKELRASTAAEMKRVAKIREICKHDQELQAQAIEENWTLVETELAQLKKQIRSQPISAASGGSARFRNLDNRTIEAAICSQVGIDLAWLDEKAEHWQHCPVRAKGYSEKELDAAMSAGEYSLGRLMHEFLFSAGVSVGPGASINELIPKVRDTHRYLAASTGFSGVNLSGILSNVMNKQLLQSFDGVRPVAQRISASRSVRDFKETKAFRMSGNGDFLELGPTGELQNMQLREEEYANRAKTYGRMLTVPRELLINDDLGALAAIPKLMGRKAATKLQKVFFTVFNALEANGFFTTARNNLQSTKPLNIANLTSAEQLFLKQVDADGDPIDVEPAILLVPPSVKVTAEEIMASTTTLVYAPGATGADQATFNRGPATNPHAGKWTVEWSPYLTDTVAADDEANWYLIANPAVLAVMEIVYLNGRQAPVIESENADNGVLGFQWKSYFDFGVAAQDYRAAVKSNSAAAD